MHLLFYSNLHIRRWSTIMYRCLKSNKKTCLPLVIVNRMGKYIYWLCGLLKKTINVSYSSNVRPIHPFITLFLNAWNYKTILLCSVKLMMMTFRIGVSSISLLTKIIQPILEIWWVFKLLMIVICVAIRILLWY